MRFLAFGYPGGKTSRMATGKSDTVAVLHYYAFIFRVPTLLENRELSGKLKPIRENLKLSGKTARSSQNQGKIRQILKNSARILQIFR